ncbi:MAG: hypothetical protein AUK47_21855 [Deltaproteobacteria bacterium CG2_30_63_29]|nr:MAG: hypothetical protein AUK47_21855 [Deltaproteobacteria bacterium CG2_30_63_29]PJB35446.1 MAG: hypothetical protein CO108_25755 [Deltaproteobacteria bacterium CG_4_9_14_3_um_filter_63_12]
MCRLVGVLLLTDGHLTDREHSFFYALMDRLGLDDDDRASVTHGIRIDADVSSDVAIVKAAGDGEALLEAMVDASVLDGEVSAASTDLIERAKALLAS